MDNKQTQDEIISSLNSFSGLAHFSELKGEMNKAIHYYKLALEQAEALYSLTEDKEDHRLAKRIKERIDYIEDEIELEDKELLNGELSKEELKEYRDLVDVAHSFLKDAELDKEYENYDRAVMMFETAIDYLNKAVKVCPTTRALELLWFCKYQIATGYQDLGEPEKALVKCRRALRAVKKLYDRRINDKNNERLSETLIKLCALYLQVDDFEKALEVSKKTLEVDKSWALSKKNYVAYESWFLSLFRVAQVYDKSGNDKEAIKYYKETEELLSYIITHFKDEINPEYEQLLDIIKKIVGDKA